MGGEGTTIVGISEWCRVPRRGIVSDITDSKKIGHSKWQGLVSKETICSVKCLYEVRVELTVGINIYSVSSEVFEFSKPLVQIYCHFVSVPSPGILFANKISKIGDSLIYGLTALVFNCYRRFPSTPWILILSYGLCLQECLLQEQYWRRLCMRLKVKNDEQRTRVRKRMDEIDQERGDSTVKT